MILALALALARLRRLRRAASGPPAPAVPKGDWGPEQPGSGERARPVAPPRKAPLGRGRERARRRARSASSASRASSACGRRRSTSRPTATLDDLRWERWGSGGAEGTGTLRVRDCDPTLRLGRQGRATRPRSGSPRRACAAARPTSTARASSSTGDAPLQRLTCVRRVDRPDEHAGAAAARRRGGRPRWPHIGHGERAISSRHQRHVHGSAACTSSAASRCTSTG